MARIRLLGFPRDPLVLILLPSNSPAKLPAWQPVRMFIHWSFKGSVLHLQTRLVVNEQINWCSWGSCFSLLSWLLTSSLCHSQGFRTETYWYYLAVFWLLENCRGCHCETKPETSLCWMHSSRQLQWTHPRTWASSSERRGRRCSRPQSWDSPAACGGPWRSRYHTAASGCVQRKLQQVDVLRSKLQPLELPRQSRDLAETVASGEESTQEQVLWTCGLWGPLSRAIHSSRTALLKSTPTGAVLQELQPVRRSHIGAVHKEQMPWQVLHTGAREKCEEVLTIKKTCCRLAAIPIPHPNAHKGRR